MGICGVFAECCACHQLALSDHCGQDALAGLDDVCHTVSISGNAADLGSQCAVQAVEHLKASLSAADLLPAFILGSVFGGDEGGDGGIVPNAAVGGHGEHQHTGLNGLLVLAVSQGLAQVSCAVDNGMGDACVGRSGSDDACGVADSHDAVLVLCTDNVAAAQEYDLLVVECASVCAAGVEVDVNLLADDSNAGLAQLVGIGLVSLEQQAQGHVLIIVNVQSDGVVVVRLQGGECLGVVLIGDSGVCAAFQCAGCNSQHRNGSGFAGHVDVLGACCGCDQVCTLCLAISCKGPGFHQCGVSIDQELLHGAVAQLLLHSYLDRQGAGMLCGSGQAGCDFLAGLGTAGAEAVGVNCRCAAIEHSGCCGYGVACAVGTCTVVLGQISCQGVLDYLAKRTPGSLHGNSTDAVPAAGCGVESCVGVTLEYARALLDFALIEKDSHRLLDLLVFEFIDDCLCLLESSGFLARHAQGYFHDLSGGLKYFVICGQLLCGINAFVDDLNLFVYGSRYGSCFGFTVCH